LKKLRTEVQAEEQRAADLEAQAKAARKNAQDKANKAAELEKEERDHVATAKRLEAEHKDLTDKVQVQQTKIKGAEEEAARLAKEKDAAEGLLSKLAAELEDINKRADAKIQEAQKKRAEYDNEKAALEDAAKAAVEASATLKEHGAIRETLIHEKQNLEERVEMTETKLVQDTEASKQALKDAERAEATKHAKWAEAEAAGKSADKFAADKLAKVETALNSQMASLTTESKEILGQTSTTKVDKSASSEKTQSVTEARK